MGVIEPGLRKRLENFLADAASATAATLLALERLSGGAIQENWRLGVELADGPYPRGKRAWVLRATAPAGIPNSHSRAEEFALLELVHGEGVPVPKPLFLCREASVFWRDFFVMECLPGIAAGHRLVRDESLDGERLLRRLGAELGRIHGIRPPCTALAFLDLPEPSPALEMVCRLQAKIEGHPQPHPVFEWALRWLEQHAPEPQALVLCHRDFRTGNYLVEGGELTGLLDWEFASWGGTRWRMWAGSVRNAGVSAPIPVRRAGSDREMLFIGPMKKPPAFASFPPPFIIGRSWRICAGGSSRFSNAIGI